MNPPKERGAGPYRILFICTGNSCRSPMAAGIAHHYGMGRVEVSSAGIMPAPLNPRAVQVMAEKDIDISKHVPQGLDAVAMDEIDLVVTLCDYAQTRCPSGPPAQQRLHWSIKDPTGMWGPAWLVLRAYRRVRDELDQRIRSLLVALQQQSKGL